MNHSSTGGPSAAFEALGTKHGTRNEGSVEDDAEILSATFDEIRQVKQGLHQRHIQMIALAGTIGTGLFLGSGKAIATSGPLGALLSYLIMGIASGSVVLAIAEMGALVPLSGGIVRYAEFFVDPALSFADGWNLVYSYVVSIPAEIVAASVLVQFWITVYNAIWITLFGLVMIVSAWFFVRVYGELEFTFSMLKIALVVLVNLVALVIACGGAPNHEPTGFKYWVSPGPFVQYLGLGGSLGRFLGFWKTLNNALYAYSGIENITLAAAETRSPRQAIPQAAKRIFWRILIFYIVTIFMVGLVVPSDNERLLRSTGTASQSPFVIAADIAGIQVVPHIINAIVITSAWSSGNSSLLGGSRTLYGMARHGRAPRCFTRINRFGIPYVAVTFYAVFMGLGYMTLSSSAATVFEWLQDLVSISTLVNFIVILITYLRFYYACKTQGIDRQAELPWAAPFQPYMSWAALGMFLLLLLTSGFSTFISGHWNTESFVSSYFNIPLILILYFGYKFTMKTKIVPLSDVPIRQFIDIANRYPEPPVKRARGIRRLNILWS
ncbi:hypothetical protein GQ53DRAFT_872516 [Thozetella sp. PMI_491]|nr:hypothetical protein GQ53DRAFT_872516 [Thozetella sp. PMI_491]